jgi:hypothetical protein
MSHHFEAIGANCVDNLGAFFGFGNLEFLLQENGCLLV